MRSILAIGRALSDENRVKALAALTEGELCMCEIVELLGLAPSTTTKHIEILRNAALVLSRRKGRWTYVRLDDSSKSDLVCSALDWLGKSLKQDEVATEIRERARKLKSRSSSVCSV